MGCTVFYWVLLRSRSLNRIVKRAGNGWSRLERFVLFCFVLAAIERGEPREPLLSAGAPFEIPPHVFIHFCSLSLSLFLARFSLSLSLTGKNE